MSFNLKLNVMKKYSPRFSYMFLALLSILGFSTQIINSAAATSIYDDAIVTIPYLRSYDASDNLIDISSTWKTHLKNACGDTIYNDFRQSLNGGKYIVSQYGYDNKYYTLVSWSNTSNPIPYLDFYSYGSERILGVSPGYYGRATFFFNRTNDVEVCDYSSTYTSASGGFQALQSFNAWSAVSDAGIYETNYPVNYPSGYSGITAPYGSATPITGNAVCANSNNVISNIMINAQSGVDGEATIVDDGNGFGGKNYSYYLSEDSPYSVTVICDGDPFYGPTVSSSLYYDYHWACAQSDQQGYCAAS